MPWKYSDAIKHSKMANTPQRQKMWASAANNALTTCESKNGSDCEGRAIRIANAAVKRIQESYVSPSLLRTHLESIPNSPERNSLIGLFNNNGYADTHSLEIAVEAVSMLAQDDSYSSRRECVSNAVSMWARAHALTIAADIYGYAGYAYIVDMYPDVVIFQWNRMLWRAPYTISTDNIATLDDPERVRLYYAPADTMIIDTESFLEIDDPARLFHDNIESDDEDVTESIGTREEMLVESDCIPITESAVKSDGTARVCVITPGWGSTGYYSAEMLERDASVAFPKGTHMHWDHPTPEEMKIRPEGTLDSLAGVFTEAAQWDAEGYNGPGVYATVKVFEKRAEVLNEISPYIGTSIKAPGMVCEGEAEGRKGRIVEALVARPTNAVDFVTIPGRGGKVLDLVEAARSHIVGPATYKTNTEEEMDQAAIEAIVKEAVTNAVAATTMESQKKITELETTLERQTEALRTRDMREIAAVEAARFNQLGERARQRVLTLATVGETPLTESGAIDSDKIRARVTDAAKAEIEYLNAEAGHGGRVRDMGAPVTEAVTHDSAEKALREAAKSLGMDEKQAELFAVGTRV